MKKLAFLSICLIVLSSIFIVGCSSSQTTTTTPVVTSSATTAASGDTVLTITKGDKTVTYTMAELQALSSVTGWGGKNTMHGNEGPYQYKGVAMSQLLKAVGGMTDQNSLVVTGSGAYTKTLTYDQVVNGNFPVMDNSGNQVTPVKTPVLFVVYEQSGAALDSTSGPLMLGIMTDQSQLTGGNLWIKGLSAIQVISAQ